MEDHGQKANIQHECSVGATEKGTNVMIEVSAGETWEKPQVQNGPLWSILQNYAEEPTLLCAYQYRKLRVLREQHVSNPAFKIPGD